MEKDEIGSADLTNVMSAHHSAGANRLMKLCSSKKRDAKSTPKCMFGVTIFVFWRQTAVNPKSIGNAKYRMSVIRRSCGNIPSTEQ